MEVYEYLGEIILKGISSGTPIYIRAIADELHHFGDIEDDAHAQILKDQELIKDYLVQKQYIKYSEYQANFYLTKLGMQVRSSGGTIKYNQKLAAIEAKNIKKNKNYNIFKDIIIPITAVLVSTFALIHGCVNTNNTTKLEKRLDSIQTQFYKHNIK